MIILLNATQHVNMESSFKQKTVEISFRKFSDYASDVIQSDFHTFPTRFKIFLHLCETDPVLRIITTQLKATDVNFQKWWEDSQKTGGSFVGSKQFDLPVEENLRDALMYQLILKFQSGEIQLQSFCMDYFGETNFDEMNRAFISAIFLPLVRSINYKLEEILDSMRVELQSEQTVPITMLSVYNDHSVTIGDGNEFAKDTVIGTGGILDKKEK